MYKNYSKFNMDTFKQDLDKSLRNRNVYNTPIFKIHFAHTLDKNTLIKKKKILRFSNNSFMTKEWRKAIMHRSKLKNAYIINLRKGCFQ